MLLLLKCLVSFYVERISVFHQSMPLPSCSGVAIQERIFEVMTSDRKLEASIQGSKASDMVSCGDMVP